MDEYYVTLEVRLTIKAKNAVDAGAVALIAATQIGQDETTKYLHTQAAKRLPGVAVCEAFEYRGSDVVACTKEG